MYSIGKNRTKMTMWVATAIVVLVIATPAVIGWDLDVQIALDNSWCIHQYDFIDQYMDGKTYQGAAWHVCKCQYWHKDDITSISMGWAKVFHFTGHGGYIAGSNNWLVTYYDENIRAWEIPFLGSVSGGGPTLLVFYNCCHSGRVNWLFPSRWLCPESLYEGAKAAIGHDDTVTAGDSYWFADEFYDLASQGYTVKDAFDAAKNLHGVSTAVLFGNGNQVLVD